MAYQVIARKYRPQRFSDVVGQEHVTRTLAQAIAQGRIAHAYLFCGPRGTGKTTIARIFAKCLNATGGPKVDFAEDDPKTQEIAEGRSLDVLEIDAASNRGIEEIRGLRDAVRYAPATSRHKIYIIDEVHMLTKEAFNALLKTLEEPPEHVKFLFATTEPEKVLVTILSRCQRFDLRRIPAALIVKHLQYIAGRENVMVDEAACYAIARGAEGGMRDAESTLDQLISFCGDKIVEEDVLSMFGLTAQTQLQGLAGAVLDGHVDIALRQLNDLAQSGKDLGRLLSDLLNHFRNLLILQISKGDFSLLEVSESQSLSLREQASKSTTAGLTRILEIFGEAEMRLRDAASKKILVEVAVLRAIEARNAVSIDSVLQRLSNLKAAAPLPATVKPTSAIQTQPVPVLNETKDTAAPVNAPAPAAPVRAGSEPIEPTPPQEAAAVPAGSLDALWAQLLDAVGKASLFARAYLEPAHPVSLDQQLLTIGYPPEESEKLSLVDNPKNQALLKAKLAEMGYPNAHVKFVRLAAAQRKAAPPEPAVTAPSPVETAAAHIPLTQSNEPVAKKPGPARSAVPLAKPGPARLSKEDFKNDPMIRAALEMFRGQIVEVKM